MKELPAYKKIESKNSKELLDDMWDAIVELSSGLESRLSKELDSEEMDYIKSYSGKRLNNIHFIYDVLSKRNIK